MCNSQILTCVHEYITWRNVCSDDILQHSFTEIRLFCALPNCMEQIHGFYYRQGCPMGNSLMPCKYIRSLPERRGILEAILWKVSIWLVCLIVGSHAKGKYDLYMLKLINFRRWYIYKDRTKMILRRVASHGYIVDFIKYFSVRRSLVGDPSWVPNMYRLLCWLKPKFLREKIHYYFTNGLKCNMLLLWLFRRN